MCNSLIFKLKLAQKIQVLVRSNKRLSNKTKGISGKVGWELVFFCFFLYTKGSDKKRKKIITGRWIEKGSFEIRRERKLQEDNRLQLKKTRDKEK